MAAKRRVRKSTNTYRRREKSPDKSYYSSRILRRLKRMLEDTDDMLARSKTAVEDPLRLLRHRNATIRSEALAVYWDKHGYQSRGQMFKIVGQYVLDDGNHLRLKRRWLKERKGNSV